MTATELLSEITRRGISIEVAGDRLRVPADIDPALVESIKAHKAELLKLCTLPPPLDHRWTCIMPADWECPTCGRLATWFTIDGDPGCLRCSPPKPKARHQYIRARPRARKG